MERRRGLFLGKETKAGGGELRKQSVFVGDTQKLRKLLDVELDLDAGQSLDLCPWPMTTVPLQFLQKNWCRLG